jgi:hypothetical protein
MPLKSGNLGDDLPNSECLRRLLDIELICARKQGAILPPVGEDRKMQTLGIQGSRSLGAIE